MRILLIVVFVVSVPKTVSEELDENLLISVTAEQNYKETTPGQTVAFDIELENLGDERVRVYCKILDLPKGWDANIVSDTVLGSKTLGEDSTSTIALVVQPPYGIGYHNERETFIVSFTPTNYFNSSLKGNEAIEYFSVCSRGFAPAGLDIAIIIVILIVVILIVALHIIPILIVLLLLSSGFVGVSNTAEELTVDADATERDELLDNLAFYYYDEYDLSKSEYYKKYFQSENSEIADLEEITIPVESQQTSLSSGPMDSSWPMKCHDLHHTSRSPYSTANVTGLEKWRFRADGWVDGGPIIGDDGTIYFGDEDWDIYAIYPNGTLRWKYHTGGDITSAPALAEDGTLYVGSWDDYLHAINPDGTLKWKFNADVCSSSPAIAQDGTIYFGVMGPGNIGRIFAVNPNGTEKWHYDTDYWIVSDPAIGDDGTIYIGSGDSYLYAMNTNGTLKWRFNTGDIVKSHPSIADDGTIYFGSFDGYLYALYLNGTMKWKFNNPGSGNVAAVIAEDGTLYLGGDKLYAIYPNGTLKWSFNLGTKRRVSHSSPAISADGTIYVGTHVGEGAGGEIIAVNPDGTERWRKLISDAWVDSSPSIGEDGTVYIGSTFVVDRGYIHAFGPVESNSPPDAPSISGTINGKVGEEYWYSFRAVDPDNNPVSYYVDWGDDTSGWVGTRASGELCYFSHEWFEKGTYNISAKVKDVMGEESDWGYLEVTMPMNQQSQNWWFLQFLQNHPRMFPILRQLLSFIK